MGWEARDEEEGRRGVEAVFGDGAWRRRVVERSPEVAALVRVYEVGVEVNRFQLGELGGCPGWDPLDGEGGG